MADHLGHAIIGDYIDPDTERARWLTTRRAGIGGSDVAAICGQSPWRSALHVWLEKTGQLADQPDAERMMWGRLLEPVVADVLAERARIDLVRVPYVLRHPEHEWMLATVDRAALHVEYGHGLAEVKTASQFAAPDWRDDEIPDHYKLQGMHYLAVTGHPYIVFGCLIGGQRLEVRWLLRDDELIAHMVTIEAEFWQMVEEGEPPAPDGSKGTTDLLAHLWDVQADLIVPMDPAEVGPLIARRHAWQAMEKHAEAERRTVENRLRWLLADGVEAVDADEPTRKLFTWRPDRNGKRTLRFPKPTPKRKAIEP